ncbi:MAG: glycoside hydrolase family 3 C-terminal domain-containing protein [Clostridia bacterium]|nr:glycoside hydrolase family 3 C-terminal domain-containing protein [Clostridia bacterium]
MKFQLLGADSPKESQRERNNRALAREAAAEGIVLLENNGILPLQPQKIALYGPGSRMTVKGGSGSGDVQERYSVTVEEGLKNAGFTFPDTIWMDRFQKKYDDEIDTWKAELETKIKKFHPIQTMQMFIYIGEHPKPCPACTAVLADELSNETETAIYVLSRQAGEGHDRRVEKGDYLLSDIEENSLRTLRKHYKNLIVVLNCGSVMDLSVFDEIKPDAVILSGQGGAEGGNALADVITGKITPSGRLTDTWAKEYEDYPSAETFGHRNGDLENEEYYEDIYVGYRWFDKHNIKPRYPFGHGLSYTEFSYKTENISECEAVVSVTNTGAYNGKETLMVFISKPESENGCEKKSLVAFAKTKTLSPAETQKITVKFKLADIASFCEDKSAFILESGEYTVFLNNTEIGKFDLKEKVLETVKPIGKDIPEQIIKTFSSPIQSLLDSLSERDKIRLVTGGGYDIRCYNNVMGAAGRTCTKLLKKGIPNIAMADGPAGLNVNQSASLTANAIPRYPDGLPKDWNWGWLRKISPILKKAPGRYKTVYRYMTAWPSETVQAQTWNTQLIEKIGAAVGREMLEIGVSVWLAPGLNIHRNPLCGRNFEYYSEDPVVSGKIAAAITRGVQSAGGVGVAQKHFCCNNQEDNRMNVSANVSQRALREIYLRAFRIAVTEGKPWTVMSSYNRVNGKYVCNSYDFCTRVLRNEWGFDGLVMSDWNATEQCSYPQAINAGNDLIMPGTKAVAKKLEEELKNGRLNKAALNLSAGRVLELVFKSEACKDFRLKG